MNTMGIFPVRIKAFFVIVVLLAVVGSRWQFKRAKVFPEPSKFRKHFLHGGYIRPFSFSASRSISLPILVSVMRA